MLIESLKGEGISCLRTHNDFSEQSLRTAVTISVRQREMHVSKGNDKVPLQFLLPAREVLEGTGLFNS